MTLSLQEHTLKLRIIEKDGICVVQSKLRFGLIANWEDEKYFKTRKNAQKYINEWYANYRCFKENKNRIEE